MYVTTTGENGIGPFEEAKDTGIGGGVDTNAIYSGPGDGGGTDTITAELDISEARAETFVSDPGAAGGTNTMV